jgi:hypothetical protein
VDLAGALTLLKQLQEFSAEVGGFESARAWIVEVQTLADKCGGYDGLVNALETAEEMQVK